MINVTKGTAHSLQQSDIVGKAKLNEGVIDGMLVRLNSDGDIVKAGAAASADLTDAVNAARYGFAAQPQTRGDVISSGKISAYGLDGNSVIHTDQFEGVIGDYAVGASVIPSATATGKVRPFAANGKIIGTVATSRTIRGTVLLGIKLVA